jgi:hypothetical protein
LKIFTSTIRLVHQSHLKSSLEINLLASQYSHYQGWTELLSRSSYNYWFAQELHYSLPRQIKMKMKPLCRKKCNGEDGDEIGFSSPESKAATRRVRVQSGSSSTIGHLAPKSNHRTTLGFGSPSRLARPTRATSPSRLGSPPRSARPRRGSRGFEQEETDLLTLAESDIRGWDVYEIIRDSVNNHAEGRKLQASGKAVEEETMQLDEEEAEALPLKVGMTESLRGQLREEMAIIDQLTRRIASGEKSDKSGIREDMHHEIVRFFAGHEVEKYERQIDKSNSGLRRVAHSADEGIKGKEVIEKDKKALDESLQALQSDFDRLNVSRISEAARLADDQVTQQGIKLRESQDIGRELFEETQQANGQIKSLVESRRKLEEKHKEASGRAR